ncbi:MAG: ABC transporter ATP-binding protein [Lawsonibacter sp.]|jgi:peptide/nickel transport system ATP-binding protein|nr:ABC transporter ATP-binding protein [Lawsonibacter sp.]
MEHILSVKDLCIDFSIRDHKLNAVDKVSLDIRPGQRLGIVGESGCGKSVTCKAILHLLADKARVSGEVLLDGENILNYSDRQMQKIRGSKISMIFQEPMASLDPLFTVGFQLTEAILLHKKVSKEEAWTQAVDILKLVQIPQPEQRMKQYPFELSGGMCQRIMIAIALSCNPQILIADEPTTALDVTIQAQILNLMLQLNKELNTALILITHDLGVIAETVDDVIVMYAGHIVERAPVRNLFSDPKHPYTQGLLASIPTLEEERENLHQILGTVPSLADMPCGCRFCTRCTQARELCINEIPPEVDLGDGREVKCWKYSERWEDMSSE